MIELGGRMFQHVDFRRHTARHHNRVMALIRKAGLDRVTPGAEESPEAYGLRLLGRIVDSEKVCDFAAVMLLPEGKTESDWSTDLHAETLRHIEGCNTEADRERIEQIAFDAVLHFFGQRLRSLATSLKSISDAAAEMMQSGARSQATAEP